MSYVSDVQTARILFKFLIDPKPERIFKTINRLINRYFSQPYYTLQTIRGQCVNQSTGVSSAAKSRSTEQNNQRCSSVDTLNIPKATVKIPGHIPHFAERFQIPVDVQSLRTPVPSRQWLP